VYGPDAVERTLDTTVRAFASWSRTSMSDRGVILRRIAALLRSEAPTHAAMISQEMGKPISEAIAEVNKCAWVCEFYADNAAEFLAPAPVSTGAARSFVQYSPLGPILAIMPWNYPYWQVMRFAAPTLMAGDSIVLKHASNVTGSALALDALLREAGLPDGVFQTVVLPGRATATLIADPRITAVTLTGSDAVGAQVGELCGRHVKKAVLELGGSDAFVVLGDADVEAAARVAVTARFQNAGQSCIAAKRFIVVDEVAERFEAAFARHAAELRVGDPSDPATQMGPMARADLRDELADQVDRAVAAGARLVLGGEKDGGAFYTPTIVADVRPGNPLFVEETFGPAAALVRATDAQDAVRLANDSEYGLGFAIWTADVDRAVALAATVQSGSVTVNGMTASDPRMPFGGVKRSGYGRELGLFGIREFVNVQGISVAATSTAATSTAATSTAATSTDTGRKA
jgi:succinate-semialdehyde dehydrogenase/glutarate-semialdehyde dehydrogenase